MANRVAHSSDRGLPVDPSAFPDTGGNLTEDDIANWTAAVDKACKKAGHQKGCLRIKPEYYDNSNNKQSRATRARTAAAQLSMGHTGERSRSSSRLRD